MNPRLYQDLEYSKVIDIYAASCHSLPGKALTLKLCPEDDLAFIQARQTLTEQCLDVLKQGMDFDFRELLPIDEVFTGENQTVYGWEEFRLVYLNARLANEICQRRDELDGYQVLSNKFKQLVPLPAICQQFERIFDAEGEVKDTASEELKRICRRKHVLREQIIRHLQRKFSEPAYEVAVQDKFVTQRDGRYVIPVKEAYATRLPGIVQGQSGSKATVFMEPEDVVGQNNELQLLAQEEKREIHRIFSSFTAEVKALQEPLTSNHQLLAELDSLYAIGRVSLGWAARIPEVGTEKGIVYKGARHPLLISQLGQIRQVIPFDCTLGTDFDFLVLSGPNTGGKTVLLKAVGLLSLMALTGLPIPCQEGTYVGMFYSVVADIGDEQSIEQALSTFSSHFTKIRQMLATCTDRTLVLLDEIGAATDPQQGAALAQAMLETFLAYGAKGIVTTHYTALKVFAENHPRCSNAAMQFDLKSLHPTYQFQLGFPGDSFAIEVAASLGLSEDLISRARELTGSQNLEFTELLKRLQEEKKTLARETWQYQLRNRNLEARQQEYEQKIKQFEAELKSRRKEFLKQQQDELITWQKLLQNELDDLRKLDKNERKQRSEGLITEVHQRHTEIQSQLRTHHVGKDSKNFAPQPGDRVWVNPFETNAIILDIKGEDVWVDMNGISFKTHSQDISPSEQPRESAAEPLASVKANLSSQYELKLLGLTFDEAQPLIDEFIDKAMISGLHNLRIVHGKGTGALRTKVRDYLKKKKQVKSIGTPPQEMGGSGVTVISL